MRLELRLHRQTILFSLAIAGFLLALLGLLPWREFRLAGSRLTVEGLVMGLYAVAFAFVYSCLIPMMIGANMIAAERAAGVWDWRLSLPESRTRQWARKVAVGAGLTALLSGVLPLALVLIAVYAATGEVSWNFGPALLLAPPCLAFGMWASGLAADSLKALCLGAALLALLIFCAVMGDPMRLSFGRGGDPLVGLVYALLLVEAFALFRWNTTFARPTRRRAAAQIMIAALPLAPLVFMTLCALNWAYSPWIGGAGAQTKARRYRPWIAELPPGVEPLLIQNASNSGKILTVYRRPGSDELAVGTERAAERADGGSAPFGMNFGSSYVERLDARRGYAGSGYPLAGKFMAFAPGRDFIISRDAGNDFRVLKGVLPIRMKAGRYDPAILGGSWNRAYEAARATLRPDQRPWRWGGWIETPEAAGNFAFFRDVGPGAQGRWTLVGQVPGGKWREVAGGEDEGLGTPRTALDINAEGKGPAGADYEWPTVSSDGRWVTGYGDVWTTRGLRISDAVWRSFDGSREITIPSKGRHLCFSREGGANPNRSENARSLGMKSQVAPISRDGRYLPFIRSEGFPFETDGGVWDSGFPLKMDLMLLDTVTGGELAVYLDQPPTEFGIRLFKQYLGGRRAEELWRAKTDPSLWGKPKPPPRMRATFPAFAWAPDRNRFATLGAADNPLFPSSVVIEIYDVVEGGAGADAVKVALHARIPNTPAAATNTAIPPLEQIAFLNGEVLLGWSPVGLYRFDIAAFASRPPGGEAGGK